jgi:hypothetical protein
MQRASAADTEKQHEGSSMPSPAIGLDEPVDLPKTDVLIAVSFVTRQRSSSVLPKRSSRASASNTRQFSAAHIGRPWIFFDFPVHASLRLG